MPPSKTNFSNNSKLLRLLVMSVCCVLEQQSGYAIRIKDSVYQDIIIDIREAVPASICSVVLENLKITLKAASEQLFTSLNGRAYFGEVIVNLPDTWPDSCIANEPITSSQGSRNDFTITATNLLFGDKIWTQQSGGCGVQGDQIYIPYGSLEGKSAGKALVKEWAKYRYGIFDEIGFPGDDIYPRCYFTDSLHVTGCSGTVIDDNGLCMNPSDMVNITSLMDEGVTTFCDERTHDRYAPTKHNLLCDRKSTLEVVLNHPDFSTGSSTKTAVTNTTMPTLSYRRRRTTRYIVVIDDSQDILLRESWSFLRNAIRKWVVYDLDSSTEVGIVLAGGKILPITKLVIQKNRDLVASFVPYVPSDATQPACIECAIRSSLELFEHSQKKDGNASHVIVILAPGTESIKDLHELANSCLEAMVRVVTINFPTLAQGRQPLDDLAILTGGMPLTIYEKKYNSEKSYLNTYFELTDALFHVSQNYREGPSYRKTIEIHRRELINVTNDHLTAQSKRFSRRVQGTFYLDGFMGSPSGFFIYTHNTETPLIQNVRVTSPSGITYNTRSDLRMPVKQLTLLANLNETGAWAYVIERFNGNPQPHFVQVMATPVSEDVNIVQARSWMRSLQPGGPFILYCEVKRGDYPVLSALVNVKITRPDVACNYTVCEDSYRLLDSGSGDPDIMKDDGIYSRYVTINTGPGIYKFETFVDDNGNTAYALPDHATVQNLVCCGSSIPTKDSKQIAPFQRYLSPLSIHLSQEDIDSMSDIPVGRIGDLIINYLSEGKISLTWTTPDMGGEGVARYEIKFAFSIEDIVDRFETAAIAWNHNTPYPYAVGDVSNFILDTNLEPRMFGQAVFFAVRTFATNSLDGLVSNVVRTYVPGKTEPTSQLPGTSTADFQSEEDDFGLLQNDTSFDVSQDIDMEVMYSLPITTSILLMVLLISVSYYLCCRRARKIQKAKQDGLTKQCSEDATYSNNNPPIKESSITTTTVVHNYATLDTPPDHHIVGIPMYDDTQKKRFSTSSGSYRGCAHIISRDYYIDESKTYSTTSDGGPIASCYTVGGHCTVENATLPRPSPRPMLNPYESWTASQLLQEHERRTSPLDNEVNRSSNSGPPPPPVPPLPSTPDIHNQFQYSYGHDTLSPLTVPSYRTLMHPSNEEPTSYYNRETLIPNRGISNSGADKKRRNVTMV